MEWCVNGKMKGIMGRGQTLIALLVAKLCVLFLISCLRFQNAI